MKNYSKPPSHGSQSLQGLSSSSPSSFPSSSYRAPCSSSNSLRELWWYRILLVTLSLLLGGTLFLLLSKVYTSSLSSSFPCSPASSSSLSTCGNFSLFSSWIFLPSNLTFRLSPSSPSGLLEPEKFRDHPLAVSIFGEETMAMLDPPCGALLKNGGEVDGEVKKEVPTDLPPPQEVYVVLTTPAPILKEHKKEKGEVIVVPTPEVEELLAVSPSASSPSNDESIPVIVATPHPIVTKQIVVPSASQPSETRASSPVSDNKYKKEKKDKKDKKKDPKRKK